MEATSEPTEIGAETTSSSSLQGLVIFARDVDRLSRFYRTVLKLDIIESEESHHLLSNNAVELLIHAIPGKIADTIKIESPPRPRGNSALKPMFRVSSLTALRPLIKANSGSLKPLKSAWTIRGDRVLDGCDSEGNVLQFREAR